MKREGASPAKAPGPHGNSVTAIEPALAGEAPAAAGLPEEKSGRASQQEAPAANGAAEPQTDRTAGAEAQTDRTAGVDSGAGAAAAEAKAPEAKPAEAKAPEANAGQAEAAAEKAPAVYVKAVAPADKYDRVLLEYAVRNIRTRLKRMLDCADGVRAGDDIEAVHDMRVWSRRTRAALEVFRSLFPLEEFRAVEREVKAVTDSLGLARDLDVMIDLLTRRAQEMPPEQRAGIESFIAALQRRRKRAQPPVEKALQRLEQFDIERQIDRMVLAARDGDDLHDPQEQAGT
jgi:hypothetical protein